ncbi:MAG: hypothetical protein SPF51_02265 [Candidatus Fimivicinus sp.]|nr:hypothetical protein [Oscillospiraceae bacterium]MDY5590359.1 hypothetical protein [Candidatus Fimivicinus sp.]
MKHLKKGGTEGGRLSPSRERKAHHQMKNAFACMEVDELGAQLRSLAFP